MHNCEIYSTTQCLDGRIEIKYYSHQLDKCIVAVVEDREDISSVILRVKDGNICGHYDQSDFIARVTSLRLKTISYIEQLNEIVDRLMGELIAYHDDIDALWNQLPKCSLLTRLKYVFYPDNIVAKFDNMRLSLSTDKYGFDLCDTCAWIHSVDDRHTLVDVYRIYLDGYRNYKSQIHIDIMDEILKIAANIRNLIKSSVVVGEIITNRRYLPVKSASN